MKEIWFSLGSLWWQPRKGAREAVKYHLYSFRELIFILVLELIAMNTASLLSLETKISSLPQALIIIGIFSFSTIVGWIITFAIIMFFLVGKFRRVVLPERLLFFIGVAHLPWICLFPLMLLGIVVPAILGWLLFLASLLSFFWLWELIQLEYDISRWKAFWILIIPSILLGLLIILGIVNLGIMIGLQGIV